MPEDIIEKQGFLVSTLEENGASKVGFGDISFMEADLYMDYPIAISLGIRYDRRIVDRLHIDENAFNDHLTALNTPMKNLIAIAEDLLTQWGFQYNAYLSRFI